LSCPACGGTVRTGDDVVACRDCGALNHAPCWEREGCGSYTCAPARRVRQPGTQPALTITAEELARIAPLAAAPAGFAVPSPRGPVAPRINRLAVAACVTAVAGIVVFGVLTGLVAVLLGCLALGRLREARQKGLGLALTGVLLGLGDVVGWLIFLSAILSRPGPALRLEQFRPDLTALEDVAPKISRAMRANVLIESRSGWFGGSTAVGSGVILRQSTTEAFILTNRHVIDPDFTSDPPGGAGGKPIGSTPSVRLVDQSTRAGEVLWIAPDGLDLALVRIPTPPPEARAARWKLHRTVRVGDPVFAIGNPHGLGWTHTQGTVSQFRLPQFAGRPVRVIQTQTGINPGNSGGGLYDDEGYLIGINTWSQDKRVSEGLNFAISIDVLAAVPPPGLDVQAGSHEAPAP
jgi:S1-C subfamily serine protease